jgi:hypothetical protein
LRIAGTRRGLMRIVYVSEGRTPHDERFLRLFASAGHSLGRVALFASPGQPLPGVADLGPDLAAQPGRAPDLARQVVDFAPDVLVAGPLHTAAFAAAFLHPAPLAAVSWGSDVLLHAERDPSARRAAVLALRLPRASWPNAGPWPGAWPIWPDRAFAHRRAPLGLWTWSALPRPARPGDESRWRLGFADTDLVGLQQPGPGPAVPADVGPARLFARAAASPSELFLLLAGGRTPGRGTGRAGAGTGPGRAASGSAGAWMPRAWTRPTPRPMSSSSCAESDGSSVSLLEPWPRACPRCVTDIPTNGSG